METKICRHCAEAIKLAAKVCPYCSRLQSKNIVESGVLPGIGMMVLLFGTFLLCVHLLTGKRGFSRYREQLVVLSADLQTVTNKAHPYPTVVGMVTNMSDHTWEGLEFEVRYFDEHGQLSESNSGSGDFVIIPRSEHAFHLELHHIGMIPTHSSHKVIVRDARDPGTVW